MKKTFLLVSLIILFVSCDKNFPIEEYYEYKSKFDESFTDQFPKKLKCSYYEMASDTDIEKNNVGFYLRLKLQEENNLESIIQKAQKLAIAKYKSSDKCLLIVNRFETIRTYESAENPAIDSAKINIECEKNLLPIPNFVYRKEKNKFNDLKLNENYEIYVFESKSGKMLEKYKMSKSPQMPDSWKNGLSKGIAISKKNKEVIYWSIAW